MRPRALMYTCLVCGDPLRMGTTKEPSREVARCQPCQDAGRTWKVKPKAPAPVLAPALAVLLVDAPRHHRWPWIQVEPGIFQRGDVVVRAA